MKRLSYRELDCIELSDGRVMVCLDTPGHRLSEEYVPVTELDRLREQLEASRRPNCLTMGGQWIKEYP